MASELIEDRPTCTVRRIFVSEMNNAVYLLTAKATGEQILIDAADDPEALSALLADGAADAAADGGVDAGAEGAVGFVVDASADAPTGESNEAANDGSDGATVGGSAPGRLRAILTTHAHWDHTRAVAELAALTGAELVIGRDDAGRLEEERGVRADRTLEGGETISVGGIDLEVIALRGHTPGSMAFATTDGDPVLLFTGDSLFPGGVGNTQKDPTRFERLLGDVRERIFGPFADDAVVYPGHGASTTLGAERPQLPEWEARGW